MGVVGAGMPMAGAGPVESPGTAARPGGVEPCGAQVEVSALAIVGKKLSIPMTAAPMDAVFRKPRRVVSAICLTLPRSWKDFVSRRACQMLELSSTYAGQVRADHRCPCRVPMRSGQRRWLSMVLAEISRGVAN